MAGEWIAEKARGLVAGIFPGQWEEVMPNILQGRCPGEETHSKGSASTDARIYLSYGTKSGPGCYCQHKSCRHVLHDLNQRFREAIFAKDPNFKGGKPDVNAGVSRMPREKDSWIPDYEEAVLKRLVAAVPPVTPEWFVERSPVDPRGIKPGEFIEHIFRPGERVMVFTRFKGPGDFLWEVGKGGYRLADERGVKAVRSALPVDGGAEGVWYLSNPVDGKWHANPRRGGLYSRRSMESVTAWRHLLLESDDAPSELWLKLLAMAPMALLAIYSSGGRSWHALARVDMPDKPSFDAFLRNDAKRILPRLGADPGALTPVRLTRLPGCTRSGKLQRLIWLNPAAKVHDEIMKRLPVRKL